MAAKAAVMMTFNPAVTCALPDFVVLLLLGVVLRPGLVVFLLLGLVVLPPFGLAK